MGGFYLMLARGVTIAYAESIEKVPANMAEVRPTLMFSTPRLYEKMYARVLEKVASDPPARQKVFHWAIGRRPPGLCPHRGGHAAGSAPEAAEGGGGQARLLEGPRARGRPAAAVRLRRRPARQGHQRVLRGRGPPHLRGVRPHRDQPRHRRERAPGAAAGDGGPAHRRGGGEDRARRGDPHPRAARDEGLLQQAGGDTAEAIEPDGWFHTGDIGMLDADGFLSITDRKKDIIVTSGGKNIAPQPIENALKTNPLIAEIVMIGNKRNFPAALVVPNFANLEKWAREQGISFASREALVAEPRVVEPLRPHGAASSSKPYAQYEKIKKVALLSREFSIETGELTPKLSVKRRVVEEKYKDLIDRMYQGARGPGVIRQGRRARRGDDGRPGRRAPGRGGARRGPPGPGHPVPRAPAQDEAVAAPPAGGPRAHPPRQLRGAREGAGGRGLGVRGGDRGPGDQAEAVRQGRGRGQEDGDRQHQHLGAGHRRHVRGAARGRSAGVSWAPTSSTRRGT